MIKKLLDFFNNILFCTNISGIKYCKYLGVFCKKFQLLQKYTDMTSLSI